MQDTTTLASQFLLDKIDSFLAAYPVHPYQSTFLDSSLKQLLIEYIERKLKQATPMLNHPGQWDRLPLHLSRSVDLELRLESYLYWGIEYIIQMKFDAPVTMTTPTDVSLSSQEMEQICLPAHWFG